MSLIDTPIACATPSQRLLHKAKMERHERLFAASGNAAQVIRLTAEKAELRRELDRAYEQIASLKSMIESNARSDAIKEELAIVMAGQPITVRRIIVETAKHFGLSVEEMTSNRRMDQHVRPRHIAMHLARCLTRASFPAIGQAMGGRDHTTILHGVKNISRKMKDDPTIAADVETIRARLLEQRKAG